MKKRLKSVFTVMLSLSLLMTACGKTQEPPEEPGQVDTTENVSSSTETETPQTANEPAASGLTPKDVPYIDITCTNHPSAIKDTDGEKLVEGGYYDFTLEDKSAEAYPKLKELTEQLNGEAYQSAADSMQAMEDMAKQTKLSGWGTPFSDNHVAEISRADSKAFSYYVMHDSYQGGAHGYVYYTSGNYDPVTGEEIDFRDVIKDTINFGTVTVEALIEDNPDLKDYFETCEDDKRYLLENIDDSISGDKVTLAWSLTYDGMLISFQDYAMGSYAAGSRAALIKYSSHPEMFNSEFYTYDGRTADKMLDSELYSLRSSMKTVTAKDETVIESGDSIIAVNYDSYFDHSFEELPYFESKADKYSVSKDYPELKARLDAINEENEKSVSSAKDAFGKKLKKEYELRLSDDNPMKYYTFSHGIELYSIRADKKVFSMAKSDYEVLPMDLSSRILTGINIDTATGKDIGFDEVVTDIPAFEETLKEQLLNDSYTQDVTGTVMEEFHKQLQNSSLVSTPEFSWVLGYEGITLYLNTMKNYNVFGIADTEFMEFIPFSEHQELFNKEYTKAPGMFAYEIPLSDRFGADFYTDLNWDGEYSNVYVSPETDSDGTVAGINVFAKGQLGEYEDFYATDIRATVVRDGLSDTYIYLQCPVEDGFTTLRIISVGYDGYSNESTDDYTAGMFRYEGTDSKDPRFEGCILTNPLCFHMKQMDSVMGSRWTYSTCAVRSDGLPMPIEDGWYYLSDTGVGSYDSITATVDIEATIVNENGDEQGTGAIVAGGTLKPYRISIRDEGTYNWETLETVYDKSRDLDLMASDGTIFRLHIETEDEYEYTYNGTPVQTLFDGFFVYPG